MTLEELLARWNMAISVFDDTSIVAHIDRDMIWLPFGATSRPTSGRELLTHREALSTSILRAVENRRGDGRLTVAANGFAQQDWVLVNMSPTGIAIRVWGRTPFARGERFTISLRAGAKWVKVEGRVCWTRSCWHRDLLGPDGHAYCQTAGFDVGEELAAESERSWQTLQQTIQVGSAELEIGLVSQLREPRRDPVVVPFRLRAASG